MVDNGGVLLGIQKDVLPNRESKLVLHTGKREAVAANVVAELMLLRQPKLELLLRVQGYGNGHGDRHCRNGWRLSRLSCMVAHTDISRWEDLSY